MRSGTLGRGAARILLLALVLVLTVVPAACSESEPVSGTTLSLQASDGSVTKGEAFDLEVRVETDTQCRGVQYTLSFDPGLLRCDDVVEGGFLKDWAAANGCSTIVLPATIDNARGSVADYGIAVMGSREGGADGRGLLCTICFTALADGAAEFTLSGVAMADSSGQPIPGVKVNS